MLLILENVETKIRQTDDSVLHILQTQFVCTAQWFLLFAILHLHKKKYTLH